jgi:predicted nucleotidyltransferase
MILNRPLQVVTPTVDGDVLSVLAGADAEFTPPQVRDLIQMHSVEGVRRALGRLVGQGIVIRERFGNAYAYRLNRDHVAAVHIVGLSRSGEEVIARMQHLISSWSVPCEYAALFGSASTGEMTEDSDIDVLIVRADEVDGEFDEEWRDQLAEFETTATAWTGNDTRVLELPAGEVAGDPGVERVLREVACDGVTLAGPLSYLARYRANPRKEDD